MRKRYSRSYTVLSFLTMFSYRELPLGGLFLHITLPQGAFYLFIFCFGGKKPLRNLQYRIQTGII